jgi:hypothetical protein
MAAASSSLATWTADHLPPRAAGMPRSSKPAAMARSDSLPAASLLYGRPSGVTALGILFAVLSGHAMLVQPFRA